MKYILFILLLPLAAHAANINVTSLADSGTGTLRACMQAKGVRTCVFTVGGPITISTPIIVTYPDLIVAGETAPSLIEVRGAGIRIHGSNTTIRHIAVRPGALSTSKATWDGVVLWSKGELKNVTLSHLSLTWAVDENLSSYGPKIHDILVEESIIAEGLHCSIHPEGCHSKGVLLDRDVKNFKMERNLFAHNQDRNPRLKSNSSFSFVNNIVYGWGGTTSWNYLNFTDYATALGTLVDMINCIYKPAVKSTRLKVIYYDSKVSTRSRVYVKGNLTPTRTSQTQSDWLVSALPTSYKAVSPLVFKGSPLVTTEMLQQYIVNNVGPRPSQRSETDTRIVNEMVTGTGGIKDCVTGCTNHAGGWD